MPTFLEYFALSYLWINEFVDSGNEFPYMADNEEPYYAQGDSS